ncbi:MAG: glycosyltransferase family 4 protein, partial [Thermodesulfovibrionia bacterium]|nr:glycosyltransferase family 4 protein [Thermodesulfovibrionia bacterium]
IRFVELGYRILIACREGSQISKKAAGAGIPIFIVKMRFACDPLAIIKFYRIIKSEKVNIIHTHSSRDSWTAGIAGRISGIPIIRSRHLSTPVGRSWWTTFVYRYLADIIISSGIHIKNALVTRNRLDPGKIVSIAAGVDTERFEINKINGNKILDEFRLKHAFPIIGIVSVLRSWKGHRYLLEAVPEVVSVYPDARFLVVGDGPGYNTIRRRISDLGIEKNVIMTGFRNDVPEIMAVFDIFILPSFASEATSQVIPQVLAMGKPVIATNVGGLPEIVEDGITGLLIPPKDHDAISNAIIWMAKHRKEANEMAMKGREKILKSYTHKAMIDHTAEVYNNVLEARGN